MKKEKIWTPAEEAALRTHSLTGAPARTALEFWGRLAGTILPNRTASAIRWKAMEMQLYANSVYGAVERKCPSCGIMHTKRTGYNNPKMANYCKPCVQEKALKRRQENNQRKCIRCNLTFRGKQSKRICPSCRSAAGAERERRRLNPKGFRSPGILVRPPMPEERKRGRPVGRTSGPQTVREALLQAMEWYTLLKTRVANQTDIACREGMTRQAVSRRMVLLRLPERIRARLLGGEEVYRSIHEAIKDAYRLNP